MSGKFYPIVSIFIFLFFQHPIFSQSFSLLKDINTGSGGSSYLNFTNVNGILYFRPDDGVHGDELWKSDGTQPGTVMIKDIYPGSNSSISSSLFNSNGVVYFQADDGVNGTELWKSDGTEAGTFLLKDIYPGIIPSGSWAGAPFSGIPNNFTSVNGVVYFAASGGSDTHEVWKTDGTIAGTTLVKDIYSGIQGYVLNNFVNLNGTLIFTVISGEGNELWKSDGTGTGTTLIKAMPGGNFTNHPTVMNGALYFLEGDGLWRSDGTTAGTILLKEKGGSFALSPELLTAVNSQLYFTGNDDIHGLELWKSDGTAAGTVLLKDIYPGSGNSDINAFTKVGNKLMFSANNGINGSEIWISDGTEAGTRMMHDIEPGSGSSIPSQFFELTGNIAEANGKVFIGAATTNFGNEVWVANSPADGPLPLQILEFEGTLTDDDGYLHWKTENESNTSAFILERSIDGNNYHSIGTLLAANTAGIHHYDFTDPNITSLGVAVVYYRLRQIDLDGNFNYSSVVVLSIENKKIVIRLYPNPVTTKINLTITSSQAQKLQWRFTDNSGRIIKAGNYSISQGVNIISEDIGFASAGIYYLQLFNGTHMHQVIKVMKQ